MPIARTKEELLDAIETEYRLLKKCIESLGEQEREQPGVCHEWSAKDVMAHLVEWKKMFLGWYEEGLRGGSPRRGRDRMSRNAADSGPCRPSASACRPPAAGHRRTA